MNEFEWVGTQALGNKNLLSANIRRIGVFASRDEDTAIAIIREKWAVKKGREHKCIIGTFHSKAECEILYFVLKHGGSAVWLLGCALPQQLPKFCMEAIRRKRLLIVSSFHREHHNIATARYCLQLTATFSNYLVFWSMKDGGLLQPIYNKALSCEKWVERF